ncbi:PTS sugar transporter subunit IIA [Amphibacillus sp. Q70]|uniref:PTS sugar transporter subunit IIA n=1 Tax=Amphibacillus sp. Q70 TaxID=3453416 RepID=UPI003F871242
MRNIIIASHHKLADGMKQTLQFISGYPNVFEISAYVEDDDINKQIEAVMQNISQEDEVFIFTDILGGSVTQNFVKYCNEQVHVIAGMNLPLLMLVALSPKDSFNQEDINNMIKEAQESIIYVNNYNTSPDSEDE